MCTNLWFTNMVHKYNKYKIALRKTNFFLVQHPELFLRVKYILAVLKFYYYPFIVFLLVRWKASILFPSIGQPTFWNIFFLHVLQNLPIWSIISLLAASIFGLLGQHYWNKIFFQQLIQSFSVYFDIIEIFTSYRILVVKVVIITP